MLKFQWFQVFDFVIGLTLGYSPMPLPGPSQYRRSYFSNSNSRILSCFDCVFCRIFLMNIKFHNSTYIEAIHLLFRTYKMWKIKQANNNPEDIWRGRTTPRLARVLYASNLPLKNVIFSLKKIWMRINIFLVQDAFGRFQLSSEMHAIAKSHTRTSSHAHTSTQTHTHKLTLMWCLLYPPARRIFHYYNYLVIIIIANSNPHGF